MARDFLRKTKRKEDAEKLALIYNTIKQGVIRTTERVKNLADQYHSTAFLSRDKHKDINKDFLIVASASVAGVNTILSLNRKTMASPQMVEVYKKINSLNKCKTPDFIADRSGLAGFLESL